MKSDEPYNQEIAWLLGEADSALGLRGTLQSTISALERGGAAGSGIDVEAIIDLRRQRGDVARWRRARTAWGALPAPHQLTLLAYYTPGRVPDPCRAELGRLAGVVCHLSSAQVVMRVSKACESLSREPQLWRETGAGRQALGILAGPLRVALTRCQTAHQAWDRAARAERLAWVG